LFAINSNEHGWAINIRAGVDVPTRTGPVRVSASPAVSARSQIALFQTLKTDDAAILDAPIYV
jgi:hypothetical protein